MKYIIQNVTFRIYFARKCAWNDILKVKLSPETINWDVFSEWRSYELVSDILFYWSL